MDKELANMTPAERAKLKAEIRKIEKGHPYVSPGTKLYGYLPLSYSEYMLQSIDYAYENRMIAKRKPFNFVSWCVKKAIQDITLDINQKKRLYTLDTENIDPESLLD